jgi:hypothetical protein
MRGGRGFTSRDAAAGRRGGDKNQPGDDPRCERVHDHGEKYAPLQGMTIAICRAEDGLERMRQCDADRIDDRRESTRAGVSGKQDEPEGEERVDDVQPRTRSTA